MTSHDELSAWQAQATAEVEPLLLALRAALEAGRPVEKLVQALTLTAARHALMPAQAAAARTLADLTRVHNPAKRAQAVAWQLSADRGRMLADRAAEVLVGRSEAFVSPYARLAAQVLVYDSFREGARAGADEGGAQFKTFVRARPVQEPRAHSSLEGATLPIDQPYVIAGIDVDGPGDPRLPWSERAWCGHILRYSK